MSDATPREHHRTDPKSCSHEGCSASFTPHHWGQKKAQTDGWFLQKDGDAWCPEHTPEWVEEWQARRQSTQV